MSFNSASANSPRVLHQRARASSKSEELLNIPLKSDLKVISTGNWRGLLFLKCTTHFTEAVRTSSCLAAASRYSCVIRETVQNRWLSVVPKVWGVQGKQKESQYCSLWNACGAHSNVIHTHRHTRQCWSCRNCAFPDRLSNILDTNGCIDLH